MNVAGTDDLFTNLRSALSAERDRRPGRTDPAALLQAARNKAGCALRTAKGPNRRRFALDAAALCLMAAAEEE